MKKGKRAKTRQAKIISSKVIYKGHSFTLKQDRLVEPSGIITKRDVIVHGGSVVVLPVFPDKRILLIRQYRHAAGQYLWEIVAGHKEPDETFLEGARRELLEETGYTARCYTHLLDFYPSPGLLGEIMKVFLAEDLTKGIARPEEDEKITSRIVTLAEAQEWIRTGKIIDSKAVSGILFYAHFIAHKRLK